MFAARLIILALAFLPLTAPLEAGFWDSLRGMIWKTHTKAPPMIDVLIINDKPSVLLEIKGRYQLVDPHTRQLISKRYMGKKKHMESLSSGLKWGEEFPGIFQLHIVPEDPQGTIFVDNIEYRGTLYIYDIGGSISIVNRVPIEEYLFSTLPAHFPESLPEETLSAIAITARTDAYYQSQNPKNRYWAVDGHTVGYRGLNSHLPEADIVQAICTTRHMVLSKTGSYEGVLTPFPATWTSNDGGHAIHQNGGQSRISVSEAENMAKRGSHAAQILSKAYPGSHIEIIY